MKILGSVVNTDIAKDIMERYRKTFLKPDFEIWNPEFNCKNLPWCYYKEGRKIYDTEEFYRVPITPDTNVYFNDERHEIMYQTTFAKVYDFVKKLEPWDEVDFEIFDDKMEWTIAVTHEDFIILYGIDLM